ncbi:MAG: WD40 repeat domain-containing protein [Epsilonproteobacteria bacterium]|nr:WD40 repeat domain-containing protein [Campylobacterota bacterium]
MMKLLILLLVSLHVTFAQPLQMPTAQYKCSGGVTDMFIDDGKLYAATNVGSVDIFDLQTHKKIKRITVAKIKDFMGDMVESKIYSIDIMDDQLLILSQAQSGFRRVDIFDGKKMHHIIDASEQLSIAQAKFLDKDTVLLALLSNELIAFDLQSKSQRYRVQISQSKFSDFALNEQKDKVAVADESGDIKLVYTKDGVKYKVLSGQNLDNVFDLAYKNGIIATAGQDRRVVVYDTHLGSAYHIQSGFLVYSVGLSPSGKLVAYSSNERNDVVVFLRTTKSQKGVFGGNKMTLTKIVFLDEANLFVASDDLFINQYKIK